MRTKKTPNLTDYQDKWVALAQDGMTIVASNDSFKIAVDDAKSKGEKHPLMVKASAFSGNFIV